MRRTRVNAALPITADASIVSPKGEASATQLIFVWLAGPGRA